jgi:tight adherence protein C
VTSLIAACLVSVGATLSVGAVALGRPDDPLASIPMDPTRPFGALRPLEIAATWPILRRVRLSRSSATRLGLSRAGWSERQVVGMKALLAAVVLLAGSAAAEPILGLPLAAVAWRVPDVALARLARRRIEAADREIPVLLDLLAVATSAGLPPQLAFRRAVEAATEPLADELRVVIDASDLGGRWRDGLSSAAERLALPDLHRLLGALARTETLGSSLADEVAHLAADVREVRRAAAAQRARTAPVKMLFPLVFLVLPAFLLLTVVPVLLTTVRSIS